MSVNKDSSSTNDYELIPIKPLYDLKNEIRLIRDELKKESTSSKILVKHMDIDLHLQRKLEKMMMEQEELKKRLGKIINFFEKAIEEETEERQTEVQILLSKIEEISEQNNQIHQKVDSLLDQKQDIFSKISEIKKDIPKQRNGSYLLRYRKTKEV